MRVMPVGEKMTDWILEGKDEKLAPFQTID